MNFLGLIWGAVFMATGGLSLIPHSLKPKSPIEQQGTFHHVGRQVVIKGPAAVTDTVVTDTTRCIITPEPTRADSLDQGRVDPSMFTPEEFRQQRDRAERIWYEHQEFIKQLNGLTDEPWNWTWLDSKLSVMEAVVAVDRPLHLLPLHLILHRDPQWLLLA